jgi:succinate dehydrogenase/fumarate reductase flavoprotein subunit
MNKRDCDFLCIGGGLGGLAGAVRAHDLGLDVLILEKSDLVGGVSAYSGGICWVGNNHLQNDGDDSFEEADAYLDYINGVGVPFDASLRRAFVRRSPEAMEYYREQAGIPLEDCRFPDIYYPDAPGSKEAGRFLEVAISGSELGEWAARSRQSPHYKLVGLTQREVLEAGGELEASRTLADLLAQRKADDYRTFGFGLAGGFIKAALTDRKVPIELEAEVLELTQSDGRITGAIAMLGGERTEITARRGVLIATGSYGNAPWAAGAENLPELEEAAPPVIEGEFLALTDPTPAAIVRAGQAFTMVGIESPGEVHPGTTKPLHREVFEHVGFPHSIIVNDRGLRFGDESFYSGFIGATKTFDSKEKRFANWPCFFIADDRFRRQYPFGPFHPGEEWPEAFSRADDLATLAEQIGVSAEGLTATVARFNEFAAKAEDPDFLRGSITESRIRFGDPNYPNPNVGPLEEPPFWGIRLKLLGVGVYSMGLWVDGDGRALTRAGDPVPGLYATGNAVAPVEQPNYAGGTANTRNITYAYLAATHAART